MAKKVKADVLLVLPTLDEGEALRALVPEIPPEFDVLVVDGQSTDNTKEVAVGAGYDYLEERHGRGQGSAIITGFEYFLKHDYRYLTLIDCDYTDNPLDLTRVLNTLSNSDLDMIVGIRDLDKQKRYLGLTTIVVKKLVSHLISLLMGWRIRDVLTGFWVIKRKAVKSMLPHLKEKGFAWVFEIIYTAWLLNLRVGEEEVGFRIRVGDTKLSVKKRLMLIYSGIKYGLKTLQKRINKKL